MDKYDALKLDNQLCFPLYACSRMMVKQYRPHLDALDLTYTQYITMMVLWEQEQIGAKDLGERLYLDSGTLTPVLKSLEAKGLVTRRRSTEDERILLLSLTGKGRALKDEALTVPRQMAGCLNLPPEDVGELYRLLYKVINGFKEKDDKNKTS